MAAACSLLLPGGISSAQTRAPSPTLNSLVAQAQQLTYQINALSEQYDGLGVELSSARTEAAKHIRDVKVATIRPGSVTGHASAGGVFPGDVEFLNRETAAFLDSVTDGGKRLQ